MSTRGLCLLYFDKCPPKLLLVGKGGSEYHFWIETILPVFVWPVLARNYGRGEKWMQAVITEVLDSRHYIVDVSFNK